MEDIIARYKETLDIPRLLKPQFFVCPVGLVGAGKTTVVKPLSERFGLLRLSSDEVRKILKENGRDYSEVYGIAKRLFEEYSNAGYRIAVDADCGNPDIKQLVEEAAGHLGIRTFWIHIDPPEEFILNKLRSHPPTWLASSGEVMVENYFKQKEKRAAEATEFDFFATIDTSLPDVGERIKQLGDRMAAEAGIKE